MATTLAGDSHVTRSITLVGMANIGKSYWSEKLVIERGFRRFDCDALIEEKLEPQLKAQGFKGLSDVGRWMGQPFAPQYPVTSRQYLDCENAVMREIIHELENTVARAPLVIDTTGSVIHMVPDVLKKLQILTDVVYLEAPLEHHAVLFAQYMANPKPVVWGDSYAPQAGEKPEDALARCYPILLTARAARYAAMAHKTIPYARHRASNADPCVLLGECAAPKKHCCL